MKTLLFALIFISSVYSHCFAEIKQFNNSFDDSLVTYSYFDRGYNENSPIEIVLRKEIYQNKTTYTIFLSRRYAPARKYVDLENIKFKINNDKSNILDINTRMVLSPVGSTYSLDVTKYIDKIKNAQSINMQIPSYTKEQQQIRYIYYELDNNILKEWKEII